MIELTRDQLQSGVGRVRESPVDKGELILIARRPESEQRELLAEGELDSDLGLVGDCWPRRKTSTTEDGSPNPEAQVTLMNARVAALVAGGNSHERWALAGDQLYVDLDISEANLPAGSRLAVGSAILEITAEPHLGCGKFARRFGVDALKFVNSTEGRELRLRGVNAKVIEPGPITVGAQVRKLS